MGAHSMSLSWDEMSPYLCTTHARNADGLGGTGGWCGRVDRRWLA